MSKAKRIPSANAQETLCHLQGTEGSPLWMDPEQVARSGHPGTWKPWKGVWTYSMGNH